MRLSGITDFKLAVQEVRLRHGQTHPQRSGRPRATHRVLRRRPWHAPSTILRRRIRRGGRIHPTGQLLKPHPSSTTPATPLRPDLLRVPSSARRATRCVLHNRFLRARPALPTVRVDANRPVFRGLPGCGIRISATNAKAIPPPTDQTAIAAKAAQAANPLTKTGALPSGDIGSSAQRNAREISAGAVRKDETGCEWDDRVLVPRFRSPSIGSSFSHKCESLTRPVGLT